MKPVNIILAAAVPVRQKPHVDRIDELFVTEPLSPTASGAMLVVTPRVSVWRPCRPVHYQVLLRLHAASGRYISPGIAVVPQADDLLGLISRVPCDEENDRHFIFPDPLVMDDPDLPLGNPVVIAQRKVEALKLAVPDGDAHLPLRFALTACERQPRKHSKDSDTQRYAFHCHSPFLWHNCQP